MWVPFITKRSTSRLERRKGGGGRGGGGRSGSSSSSGSNSGGSASSGSSGTSSSGGGSSSSGGGGGGRATAPISTGGGSSKSASTGSFGGGAVSTIPSGSLFAGRSVGGGNRNQVYGTSTYGSGYPGGLAGSRGVAGLGFPFYFWPLAWGGAAVGTAAYLHNTEYGRFDNSSRPGGIMVTAAFTSTTQNTTYRLVADNTTVTELIPDLVSACSSSNLNNSTTIVATNFNDSLAAPRPEQAVQYYRASSVALTLDGYNNTGALGPEGTPDTPLPSNIDTTLLNCLNSTIGMSVPLVDGSIILATPSTMGLVGLAYLVWSISSFA